MRHGKITPYAIPNFATLPNNWQIGLSADLNRLWMRRDGVIAPYQNAADRFFKVSVEMP